MSDKLQEAAEVLVNSLNQWFQEVYGDLGDAPVGLVQAAQSLCDALADSATKEKKCGHPDLTPADDLEMVGRDTTSACRRRILSCRNLQRGTSLEWSQVMAPNEPMCSCQQEAENLLAHERTLEGACSCADHPSTEWCDCPFCVLFRQYRPPPSDAAQPVITKADLKLIWNAQFTGLGQPQVDAMMAAIATVVARHLALAHPENAPGGPWEPPMRYRGSLTGTWWWKTHNDVMQQNIIGIYTESQANAIQDALNREVRDKGDET